VRLSYIRCSIPNGTVTFIIIILPLVLYGDETCSVAIREEQFENRMLRRTFGPKREEVTNRSDRGG
jgi:hypothetical protein